MEDVRSVFWPGRRSGAEVAPAVGEKGLLGVGSGTSTSRSPVDFFDGGGPLIESPWLFLLRISFFLLGESLSDSKSSISPSLAALSGPSLSLSEPSEMTASESLSSSESLPEASLALAWLACCLTTLGDN